MAARMAHNHQVAGSSPAPATLRLAVLAQCRHSRSGSLKNKRTNITEKCCPELVEGSFCRRTDFLVILF